MRKRIAVLMAKPDNNLQVEFLDTVFVEAKKADVDILVFTSFSLDAGSEEFSIGEANIFNLPNYDMIDGVIVLPDSINYKDYCIKLEDYLYENYKDKVLFVEGESRYFPVVSVPNFYEIETLTDHFIDIHGCKEIVFMSGWQNHCIAEQRLQGFQQSLTKHGIEFSEKNVVYGDFWYNKGEEAVETILYRYEGKLPDAIICASDTMAISVQDALEKRGYHVPEDVLLAGYDANGNGITRRYSVTSVICDIEIVGITAFQAIMAISDGKVPKLECEKRDVKLVLTNSCSCQQNLDNGVDKKIVYKTAYEDDYGFHSGFNFMMESMIGAPDLEECLWKADWYTHYIERFDDYYLCLCENWENYEGIQGVPYQVDGYAEQMLLVHEKHPESHRVDLERTFPVSIMLPDLMEEKEESRAYFFSPIHFNDRCFGYAVLSYKDATKRFSTNYCMWLRNLNNVLESIRKERTINMMYKKIKRMYAEMHDNAVRDLLTGIYNRNGFNIYAKPMLDKAIEESKNIILIAGDLNCLKYINDTYGHNSGDIALIEVANALKKSLEDYEDDTYAKSFRMGGDEYTQILVGNFNMNMAQKQCEKINDYLEQYNANHKSSFPIYLSLGAICVQPQEGMTVESLVSIADKKMFENKKKMKIKTGFNYSRNE